MAEIKGLGIDEVSARTTDNFFALFAKADRPGRRMKVTILGCGTSGGVPRIGNVWGDCDPNEPKNRRSRASIHIESAETSIIIDTSPDFREQCLRENIERLDAVLYTHEHADHTHGIDDLRGYMLINKGERVPVYGDQRTLDALEKRFGYIFYEKVGYPSVARTVPIDGPFEIGDLSITPFSQQHGRIQSLGFRIGDFAYSTDLNGLDEAAFAALDGVKTWIVDALRYEPHPTHTHLDQTLAWVDRVQPERAILTHMTWDMDYETLRCQLPAGIEPGYDGMVIDI